MTARRLDQARLAQVEAVLFRQRGDRVIEKLVARACAQRIGVLVCRHEHSVTGRVFDDARGDFGGLLARFVDDRFLFLG